MSNISLTASMRSNLLSLQNISGQVSLTQNRLATGKKVNSAIDNPSNFYTASSLSNRAKDLDNLLDAMSQATSTIKAATTTLETATTFLEQASAVATQALETAIPAKEYFENLVGENGAVVSTAQELKDAVNAGKETICVYGKIDYFENETLILKDGQNLVGTEYFTGYTGKEKFSQINFSGNQESAIYCYSTNTISDLSLNFESLHEGKTDLIQTSKACLNINNLELHFVFEHTASNAAQGSICLWNNSSLNISGINNIDGRGAFGGGIYAVSSTINITEDATLNIKAQKSSIGINGIGIGVDYDASLNVFGKLNIDATHYGIYSYIEGSSFRNPSINIYRNASVAIKSAIHSIVLTKQTTGGWYSYLDVENGAKIELQDYKGQISLRSNGSSIKNNSSDSKYCNSDTMMSYGDFTQTESSINWDTWQAVEEREKDTSTEDAGKQYSEILNQYDGLINDGAYKGVNLLKEDNLKVNFNEKNSASLEVQGKAMTASALGFVTQNWSNQGDIAQSLKEISSALNSIRNYNAELGNNYSILNNRQNFTESLINVLTEGADKLTLADMNEESANMLALQTRQQLAINSLSLASQASQSILKLF